ncbi:MAG TPA: ice-binding family protein, partial [Nannocystis sp.]
MSLALVAGCSGDVNIDISNTDGSQGSTSAQTTGGTTQTTGGPGTTDDLPTTGATSTSGLDTEQGGSQSASQSGSETTADPSSSGDPDTTSTGTTATTGELIETTGTAGECMPKVGGPAPVILGMPDDLGMPGAYAVLAKTAVSSVPGGSIDGGHVGVSPAAASAITGFSLILDPSGEFATSTTVIPPYRVYAANYTVPTPALLTTAVLGMQAAYTDAASRVPSDQLDLEDGDIGGLTLEPGIYTWGSTVLIPEDVTLFGCEDDVWILQV